MVKNVVLGSVFFAAMATTVQGATLSEVARTQRQLKVLGYDAGVVDGLWGGKTRRALEAFLTDSGQVYDGKLDQNEFDALVSQLKLRGLDDRPKVQWEYRATSLGFGGYDMADVPVFDMIRTIREIPNYGFNVLTIDFRCIDRRDESVPDYYPIGRRLGCDIANRQILEEDGFASTRRDATNLAIDEARAANLAVNLKPMFLELGRRFGEPDASGYGKMPVDVFFEGDGRTWSGYRSIILGVAEYAEAEGVEYLTIGTELNNLNSGVENDARWSEIIASIRGVYSGQLIYAHNFNNKSNLRKISASSVIRQVDMVGLNFFPTRMMNGRKDYTVEEVAIELDRARTKAGRNMMDEAERLQRSLGLPIILSETHFPTWRGSANWIFRGGCDYQNKGRSGWQYTHGPLQAKSPSNEHGRVLAEGFMLAFEDEAWVHGADYLYWSVAHAHDDRTDRQEYGPCSSWLWESDDGIKEMIRDFHGATGEE